MKAIISVLIAVLWYISNYYWSAIDYAPLIDHFKNHK